MTDPGAPVGLAYWQPPRHCVRVPGGSFFVGVGLLILLVALIDDWLEPDTHSLRHDMAQPTAP